MGLFSKKGADVAKKNKHQSSDDTTLDSSVDGSIDSNIDGADAPAEPEASVADPSYPAEGYEEDRVADFHERLPEVPPAALGLSDVPGEARTLQEGEAEIIEGIDPARGVIQLANEFTRDSNIVPGTGDQRVEDRRIGDLVQPGPVAGSAAAVNAGISQADRDDFTDEIRRSKIRQYVIDQGVISPGEAVNASDEQLDELYAQTIGLKTYTTPTPELALSPAQRAQAILQSSSRQEKLALVAARSNLTEEHAIALSDVDLDAQVHAVVVNELAAEEEQRALEAARSKPFTDIPFGGDAPKYYVLTKGVRYAAEGQMVDLKAGDKVNDRNHDIAFLKRHGAELEQVVAPDPSASF